MEPYGSLSQGEIEKALSYIDPSTLLYQEWLEVGMALHAAGFSLSVWEEWSKKDARYKPGECAYKWKTFRNPDNSQKKRVGLGSLIYMAKQRGYQLPHRNVLMFKNLDEDESSFEMESPSSDQENFTPKDFNNVLTAFLSAQNKQLQDQMQSLQHKIENRPGAAYPKRIDESQLPMVEFRADPVPVDLTSPFGNDTQQLITYLEALFEPEDIVSYCSPYKGRPTAGFTVKQKEMIQKIKTGGIKALGIAPSSFDGAWIRFNPVDGSRTERNGISDDSVTKFRYALIECDHMSLNKQLGLYQNMNLPIKALVYSGKRSLHALIHIDAQNKEQYDERVSFIFDLCKAQGIAIDQQNKNAGRLSRLPGAIRNEHEQALLALDLGAENYEEWRKWYKRKQLAQMLPAKPRSSLERMANEKNEPVADELIHGILRCGHKFIFSAPSKAGKSYIGIELATALSQGSKWMGYFQTRKSKVLYLNNEIDPASFREREKEVKLALGLDPYSEANFDELSLRGHQLSLEEFIDFLIATVQLEGYEVVLIDPIYKIMSGDENNTEHVRRFLGLLDRICLETKAAVIYIHHYSKMGGNTYADAINRASGSGMLGRDNDAIGSLSTLSEAKTVEFCYQQLEQIAKENGFDYDSSIDPREAFKGIKAADFWIRQMVRKMHVLDWDLREFTTDPMLDFYVSFNFPLHTIHPIKKELPSPPKRNNHHKKSDELKEEGKQRKHSLMISAVYEAMKKAFICLQKIGQPASVKNLASVYVSPDQKRCRGDNDASFKKMVHRALCMLRDEGLAFSSKQSERRNDPEIWSLAPAL